MATTVYQTDKRSGITYAYESVSHWDREKQQSRSKRKLIGRVNVETKEIVPTDGRGRKKAEAPTTDKLSLAPEQGVSRYFMVQLTC